MIRNRRDVAPIVMAGLVPAIRASAGAATDGRDKPGHDGVRLRIAGALAIAATALLMQGCAEKPAGPGPRIFNVDQVGGAKTCDVPKVTPTAGQETRVEVKVGNDGGWCGITVSNGGKPFAAGLLATGPAHGKVLIHTVGHDTRIDYTPARAFHGTDGFVVRLIPGDATIRASVAVGPP